MTAAYPSSARDRTRWILEHRGPRNAVRNNRPYAYFNEQERLRSGKIADVATIFLTNRECPWKCAMCDLWRNTTVASVAPGDIPKQMRFALDQLGPASVLKLYNSGSFFDAAAIPPEDWPEIAKLCRTFEHVIVECHPALIDQRVLDFKPMIPSTLEIAIGLETAHPAALEALNKRVTIDEFKRAAAFLRENEIQVRTFLLVHPPFIRKGEQVEWLNRSVELAFDAGSEVISLIPLRAGNGAVEELIKAGLASEPTLRELETAQEEGLSFARGRVFADTWDLERFTRCEECIPQRRERIHRMNLTQRAEAPICCSACGNS